MGERDMSMPMVEIAKSWFRTQADVDAPASPKPKGRTAVQGRILLPNGHGFKTLRKDVFETAIDQLSSLGTSPLIGRRVSGRILARQYARRCLIRAALADTEGSLSRSAPRPGLRSRCARPLVEPLD